MKAKSYGTTFYLVKVYFYNKDGRIDEITFWEITEKAAISAKEFFQTMKGKQYEGEFTGKVDEVFTFTAKQCDFE